MSSIKIFGVAIFELKRDLDVALLDLQVAGIKNLAEELDEDHVSSLSFVEEEFSEFIFPKARECRRVDYAGEISRRLILIRLYRDKDGRVFKALIVTLRGGVLRTLSKKLERLGWRKTFLFEIRRILHKAHVDY